MAFQHQQSVDASGSKRALLVFAKHHRQHRTVTAGELPRQAQQVAVVAAQAATHHVRHHVDVERRRRHLVQWQLNFHRRRALGCPALLEGHEFDGYSQEQRVQGLRAVDNQFNPRHWLLPDSRSGGGELGRRFAASLKERPATRVWQIKGDECIGRAGAGQEDLARPLPRLILAAAECAEPVSETRHEALSVELSTALARSLPRIEDLGAVAVDPAAIPMAEAEFIFSGGNGVKDWALFHQTAAALGATEGASRVAVDDGFMARDRQVGASGTWVTARVYVAVGISGAIQHLQGIGACDKVVAINLAPGCDMIKRADLSVIGESAAILQALIAAVEAYRNGAKRDAA